MGHQTDDALATAVAVETVTPAVIYALIIGIDNYKCSDIPALTGAVSDAITMYEYLFINLRVPAEHIKVLRDEEATRKDILREIKALGARPGRREGDPVLIYFAGHGIATAAPKEWDEKRSMMSLIVPYDAHANLEDAKMFEYAIPDRTIGALLHQLAEVDRVGDNITVIFDCCHSGSGTRGSTTVDVLDSRRARGFRWNGVLPSSLDQEIVREGRKDRDANVAKGYRFSGSKSHVLLAACRETESAFENNMRGYFTQALIQALRAVKLDQITYRDLISQISSIPGQTPQCEGFNVDRVLFGARIPGRGRSVYEVKRLDKGGFVAGAGSIHGVVEGTTFSVFADRDITPDTQAIATLRTTKVQAFKSHLDVLDCSVASSKTPLDRASTYFAVLNSLGKAPALRLLMAPEDHNQACLREALSNVAHTYQTGGGPAIAAESNPERAHLEALFNGDDVTYTLHDWRITEHGLKTLRGTTKAKTDQIQPVLSAATRFFWHLHHAPGTKRATDEKVKVQVFRLKPDEGADPGNDLREPLTTDGGDLVESGIMRVTADEETSYGVVVRNDYTLPLHVWAFYFNASTLEILEYYRPPTIGPGAEGMLPARCEHAEGCIHPQDVIDAGPTTGELNIGFGAGGGLPYQFVLPDGQDLDLGFIKFFISTHYVDFSGIEQRSPFTQARNIRRKAEPMAMWDTITITVVQNRYR